MSIAVANTEGLKLKKFLVYSILFHVALVLVSAVATYIEHYQRGNQWGGVGGELGGPTKVNLVSSAAIPLPKEAVVPESKAVDPTKGLYKEEKKAPEPKTPATNIPKFKAEKPLPPTHKSRVDQIKTPPPEGAVPYGKGGNPDMPTGSAPTHGDESSGVSILGQGGADFATRYGWYIDAAKSRIYSNWQQWTIDSGARNSRTVRCSITFTINRDGSVKDVHITQSSGNTSYDNSAYRAVLSSNPLGKLPNDYSGAYVIATLDFNPPGVQ